MAAITVDSSANYDLCSGQALVATLDVFTVNNGQLLVNTDTKFCSGHATSATVSNGSLDHVTIASTAINGELKLDGTSVYIIPIRGGSGTAPVPIPTALVPTAASWSAGLVTLTFAAAHGYLQGDRIGVGSIKGSELINGYSGTFTINTVPTGTTLTYFLEDDPGTATITTGKVLKYYKCSQTQTKTVSAASWAANVTTYTTSADHKLAIGNSVVITGASPAGYNGTFTVVDTPTTTTFTVAQLSNPGTWTSGGTVTKTVDSTYLGFWSSWTAGPVAATIGATGWIKVKDVVNGPFVSGVALTIQGGTTPAATPLDSEQRGWIEVIGAELSTTPAIYTIPRLGKFTVSGDWFYPKSMPFTVSTASWVANVTTYTTAAVHGLAVGSFVEIDGVAPTGYNGTYSVVSVPTTTTFTVAQVSNPGAFSTTGYGWGEIRTSGVAQQIVQLPASGGATVGTTSYAGVWVETAPSSGVYDWFPSVGNATATASMFATDQYRGKVVHMLSGAGAVRFGGDGTNAWGYLPPAGCRIRIGNVVSVNATKVVTNGVSTQTVPNATLTSRPKFTTTSAGVVSIDKWMSSWYPTFAQPYSVNMSNVGVCESFLISEISQPVTWDNVNIGMSVIASSNQQYAMNLSTCYAGGIISDCHWVKYHNGTASYYGFYGADLQGFTFNNCSFGALMTTAVGGATARNATSGAMTLTRVAASVFNNPFIFSGSSLLTTCTNLTFNNTAYSDSLQAATTTTTGQYVYSLATNSSNIKIDGLHFNSMLNVHPYNGLVLISSASNNVKVRNIGSPTMPLTLGSANACGVIWAGATGGAAYNLEFKRIYTTLSRTGLITGADNSYSGIVHENVWAGAAQTYTNISLNVKTKGVAGTNAVAGQTSVYGHTFEDMFTPVGATIATGTSWVANVTSYTTSAAHGLVAGDVVTISGVIASVFNPTGGYNGTYTVLASGLTSTVFKVDNLSNPGTWTSGGTTNPLLGKLVLQMNEQTAADTYYTFDKAGPGSGFTSVGTLVLLNLDDTISFETPYYVIGHKAFTNGTVAPYTITQPTFTSTNPNNHNWFYDINTGSGFSGVYKNLHFKGARGAAGWAITGTTTATLTPVTATCVGSISGSTLTVTSVSAGFLYEGMILTGTGITAGTVITGVTSITGKAGVYTVGIMTVSGGTYTITESTQTAASTTITASTSVYGIIVNDNVFDLTTAGNVATNAKVSAITSLVAFTLSLVSTNSTSQVLAFSSINSITSLPSTGFKLRVKCRVNTVSTTNSLTTVAIPTVTNATYQQYQYPLETNTVSFTGIPTGTDVVILSAGTSTIIESIDANPTSSYNYVYAGAQNIDIGFIKTGYVPYYIRNLALTATDSSIPVALTQDRNFV